MKILIIIPYFFPANVFGGPVKVAFDIGKELVKRGHDVTVYTSDAKTPAIRVKEKFAEVEGMRVYYFKNLSMFLVKWSNFFVTPGLCKKLRTDLREFDIIHVHEYTTFQNIFLHRFARKNKIPYVLQVHGSIPKVDREGRQQLYEILFGSALLRDSSKVVALNSVEAKQYVSVGVSPQKIEIIPNGINPFDGEKTIKGQFKKDNRIPNDKKIIIYVGRIHKSKGIDLLINAYDILVKKMNCTDTLLIIAGPDDGYLAEAKSLVNSLNLGISVLFVGYIKTEEKFAVLADSDVFVTPAFYGFPITFLEACSIGLPIITTTKGDQMDWIDGKVGIVTSPTSLEIAKAMKLILSNKEMSEGFSAKGKMLVHSTFSIEKMVNKVEHMYEEIINHTNYQVN
jgi:glycosyltransferase involved in cell wall biosynthesis